MEVSSVEPPSLPCTRLPTLTRCRLTRPVIGASTWVNSTLSCAAFSAPSACVSAACAACNAWRRWSTTCSETALVWTRVRPRSSSRLASSTLARASASWPLACSADRLERPRIDDVKQVAGMDHVAVLELDTVDEAADAGADLNLLDRLEAAGELVPIRDGPFDRLRHRHRRRRRGGLRLRLLAAASERQREQHTDRCPAASWKATKRTAIEPGRRSRMLRSVSRTHFRLPKDLECCN